MLLGCLGVSSVSHIWYKMVLLLRKFFERGVKLSVVRREALVLSFSFAQDLNLRRNEEIDGIGVLLT